MEILDPGYRYALAPVNSASKRTQVLRFHKDGKLTGEPSQQGCSTQEVIRAAIDSVKHAHSLLPHPNNVLIVRHLRRALTLHESRHLDQLVLADTPVELLPVQKNGYITPTSREK
jgi:hypothetical protein